MTTNGGRASSYLIGEVAHNTCDVNISLERQWHGERLHGQSHGARVVLRSSGAAPAPTTMGVGEDDNNNDNDDDDDVEDSGRVVVYYVVLSRLSSPIT